MEKSSCKGVSPSPPHFLWSRAWCNLPPRFDTQWMRTTIYFNLNLTFVIPILDTIVSCCINKILTTVMCALPSAPPPPSPLSSLSMVGRFFSASQYYVNCIAHLWWHASVFICHLDTVFRVAFDMGTACWVRFVRVYSINEPTYYIYAHEMKAHIQFILIKFISLLIG